MVPGGFQDLCRPEITGMVNFGRHTESVADENGRVQVRWVPDGRIDRREVRAHRVGNHRLGVPLRVNLRRLSAL